MKTITIIGLSVISAVMLISCCPEGGKNHDEDKTNGIEQKARKYLQPMLHIGDSTTNIIEQFGLPFYQYETQSHELSMNFFFSDKNHEALAAGVGGFTAFFTRHQLTRWDPIYESINPKLESSLIKHSPVMFGSDHAVLTFHLVSQEQKNGFIYIDNPMFTKLGYINKSPDIAIQSGQYIVYDSAPKSMHTVELLLSQEDSKKLQVLTSNNVGKQMALLIGSQVVFAPYVQEPISDGRVVLELSEPADSILLRALKAARTTK